VADRAPARGDHHGTLRRAALVREPALGRSWNLLFAVLIYVVYNNTLSIFQAWTASGRIPTWVGLWPVHLAMTLAVVGLFAGRWAASAGLRSSARVGSGGSVEV
jgi:Predicted permeases